MDANKLEMLIFEFVKNRTMETESITSRHIHRRFDIEMTQAEEILINLSDQKLIEKFYDEEYQEDRYKLKK
jgi:hypothetical protein